MRRTSLRACWRPSAAGRKRRTREAICPYRGLDAFREEDSAFFFGRGSTVDELVRKVREHPFVMVVGRSGSGKVFAGLCRIAASAAAGARPVLERSVALARALPAARAGGGLQSTCGGRGSAEYADKIRQRSGQLRTGDPELLSHMIREELDRAEGRPDRLLLYIDQWEELYAQAPSSSDTEQPRKHAADVNRFIDLLLTAARTAPVDGGRHGARRLLRSADWPSGDKIVVVDAAGPARRDVALRAEGHDR